MTRLVEATEKDSETIARFLHDMVLEVGEFPPESVHCIPCAVNRSFQENVHWFLFVDEDGKTFGTCYCQSLFNYWSLKNRYYFGAFYVAPSHRRKGFTQTIYKHIKDWVKANNGMHLFCFIHKDNLQSQKAFSKAGCEHLDEMQIFFDAF